MFYDSYSGPKCFVHHHLLWRKTTALIAQCDYTQTRHARNAHVFLLLNKSFSDRHPRVSRKSTLFLKHALEMEFNIIALQLIT